MSSPDPSVAPLEAIAMLIAHRVIDELRPTLAEVAAPRASAPAPLLTKGELATHLAVTPATIDRYVGRGMIPCVRLGPDGPRRFRLDDVLAALAKHEEHLLERQAARSDARQGVRLLQRSAR